MSHPPSKPNSTNNEADHDHPPATSISTCPLRLEPSTVKKIAEKYEHPQPQPLGAEPAKPKHDLKEEYKDPWMFRKEEERIQRERVKKGDGGLDPYKRELWERAQVEEGAKGARLRGSKTVKDENGEGAREQEDGARSSSSERDEQEDEDQLSLSEELKAHLPRQQASLPLARGRFNVLPSHTMPFAYALEPWLQAHPEYRPYLVPTTPSSSSLSSLPSRGSSVDSGEVSVRTDEAFPEIPFESIAVYLRDRDELEVRLKILHVRVLLSRCSVLWRTGNLLEHQEWKSLLPRKREVRYGAEEEDDGAGRLGKTWYKAYSKAGRAAEKAEKMARDLGIDGLQARTWYWKGRADGGRRYWDEAAAAFRRAVHFDTEKEGVEGVEEYGRNGLTPFEKRDVEWLRDESQKRDELAQRKWQKSVWARGDVGDGLLEELIEEGVDEAPIDLRPLGLHSSEGNAHADEERFADVEEEYAELIREVVKVVKEKYKMRYFEPFSEQEQKYILYGDERKRKKNLKSEIVQNGYSGD